MDANGSSSSSAYSSPESEKQNETVVNTPAPPDQTMYKTPFNTSMFFTPENSPKRGFNETYTIIETPVDSNNNEREGQSSPKSSKKLPIQKILAKMPGLNLLSEEVQDESSRDVNADHPESIKRVPSIIRRSSKIPILARPLK